MACLLVVASALSLAPGTALAQSEDTTPPTVTNVIYFGNGVIVFFDKHLEQSVQNTGFSVIVNGEYRTITWISVTTNEHRQLTLSINPAVTAGDDVIVLYDMASGTNQLRQENTNIRVENFAWDVNNQREIPLEQAVYAALGRYFEGTGSLSQAERFVDTYYEDLKARLAAGNLSLLFKIGQSDEPRTAWGKPGTENWGQVGFPWGFPREICTRANDPSSCKDMSEIWGSQYQCGGRNMPGFSGGDHTNFFWACTPQGQWVPVKRHRPSVDYTPDNELDWQSPNPANCDDPTEWDCLGGSRGSCRQRAMDPKTGTYRQRTTC